MSERDLRFLKNMSTAELIDIVRQQTARIIDLRDENEQLRTKLTRSHTPMYGSEERACGTCRYAVPYAHERLVICKFHPQETNRSALKHLYNWCFQHSQKPKEVD